MPPRNNRYNGRDLARRENNYRAPKDQTNYMPLIAVVVFLIIEASLLGSKDFIAAGSIAGVAATFCGVVYTCAYFGSRRARVTPLENNGHQRERGLQQEEVIELQQQEAAEFRVAIDELQRQGRHQSPEYRAGPENNEHQRGRGLQQEIEQLPAYSSTPPTPPTPPPAYNQVVHEQLIITSYNVRHDTDSPPPEYQPPLPGQVSEPELGEPHPPVNRAVENASASQVGPNVARQTR